jgi:hypothetical protein
MPKCVQSDCYHTLPWLISFSLGGSAITPRYSAATGLVSSVAGVVVAVLAAVYFARVLHGHMCKHLAWPVVGCTWLSCWVRNRRIHHPARLRCGASDIVRRQHRFLVRSNQSMKPIGPFRCEFSVFATTLVLVSSTSPRRRRV